jgi:hypothetical protein
MDYSIYFDSRLNTDQLRTAITKLYDIPSASIYVGAADDLPSHAGPDPIIVIYRSEHETGYDCEFGAGEPFATIAQHITEFELAQKLCEATGTSALIDGGEINPDAWLFIDQHGNIGPVIIDEDAADEGIIVIHHATTEIPGHPEITVHTTASGT